MKLIGLRNLYRKVFYELTIKLSYKDKNRLNLIFLITVIRIIRNIVYFNFIVFLFKDKKESIFLINITWKKGIYISTIMIRILLVVGFILSLSTVVAQTVYKTPSGKKYHSAYCRYVKNVSTKITVAEARKMDLSACSQCRPDQAGRSNVSLGGGLGIKNGEAKGVRNASVQCKGTTKSGARCKRMTKNINSYCFQHEPN